MSDPKIEFVEFRQSRSAAFRKLNYSKTIVSRVRLGWKTVQADGECEISVEPGEFVYLQCGDNFTLGNFVGDRGLYLSEGLVFDTALITEFLQRYPNPAAAQNLRKGATSPHFEDAFSRLVDSLVEEDLPRSILEHRAYEFLLCVQQAGVKLHVNTRRELIDRVKTLFESDLERQWRAPNVARELGMSESTLRRALTKSGTSFTEELREARLSHALLRIQTTDSSLAEIAYESGFSSQSRLSEAFRHRFDFSPGKIRASEVQMTEMRKMLRDFGHNLRAEVGT